MSSRSGLFLSPHPDDLVYSAFAAVTQHSGDGYVLVFFNVSRFTKWGLQPKVLATLLRTLEEKTILTLLGLSSRFLWMNDSSSREEPLAAGTLATYLAKAHANPASIYCPLAISGHPDHLAVRQAAIEHWSANNKQARLYFYEDLPYAARMTRSELEVERCLRILSRSCGRLSIQYSPLSKNLLRKKLRFSRLYLSQNDHTKLLERHARELGREYGSMYAERYLCSD